MLEAARIDGAKGCVINISGGRDMTLEDMTTASEVIYDVVDLGPTSLLVPWWMSASRVKST